MKNRDKDDPVDKSIFQALVVYDGIDKEMYTTQGRYT